LPQDVQMVRGVGHRLPDLLRQRIHRARSLAEDVEDLQAGPARQGLPDPGELLVDGFL